MLPLSKRQAPLIFFALLSVVWTAYYQTEHALNDYGTARLDWLLMVDGLIALPALCFFCVKHKVEAALKAASYSLAVLLLGVLVIPAAQHGLWPRLESVLLGTVLFLLGLECALALIVRDAVGRAARQLTDPDRAIAAAIRHRLGGAPIPALLTFFGRAWAYACFAKQIDPKQYPGEHHFSYHRKDDAKNNLFGFILLIALETPLTHFLLHFVWSPAAANTVTALSLLSLFLLVAEYRASERRPVSLNARTLVIRYGIRPALRIARTDIQQVTLCHELFRCDKKVKRFNFFGEPNLRVELSPQAQANYPSPVIYLGLDRPQDLSARLTPGKTSSEPSKAGRS